MVHRSAFFKCEVRVQANYVTQLDIFRFYPLIIANLSHKFIFFLSEKWQAFKRHLRASWR